MGEPRSAATERDVNRAITDASTRDNDLQQEITWIRPARGWRPPDLAELWRSRELMYFLVWRDVKVRYKQTIVGAAWAVLQPVAGMVVFSIFFGWLARMPSDGVPYPVFSFAALVPWTFFANSLSLATGSVVTNQNLVRKVYFPRLALPLSAVLSSLVDFALAFAVLLGLMFMYGLPFRLTLLWTIPLMGIACMTSLGVGLGLSALNAQFRDVAYMLPFTIQVWLFATPVVYSTTLLPENVRPLLGLNPMAGVIDGFRWALLGTDTAPGLTILVSVVTATLLLVAGGYVFRRAERVFADVV